MQFYQQYLNNKVVFLASNAEPQGRLSYQYLQFGPFSFIAYGSYSFLSPVDVLLSWNVIWVKLKSHWILVLPLSSIIHEQFSSFDIQSWVEENISKVFEHKEEAFISLRKYLISSAQSKPKWWSKVLYSIYKFRSITPSLIENRPQHVFQ